ncbi:claudin-34-like [Pseudoliparis swirei]|uniref:claudin-34-like n=1 Tax=Pseudoliparis swirei TaxID=2059687 RepID=UPI0024BEE5C0|nr:claudin-34-like [Pseudoliparis swirei]
MPSPAHAVHAQLGAMWLGCVGWALTAVALGLVQWRVWLVSDREAISSGVAWVGLWRACFYSHTHVTPGLLVMHCESMGLTEAFTPPEVAAGQVLMLVSLLAGIGGNAAAVYALRNAFFGMGRGSPIRSAFVAAGVLCLLAGAASLAPLLWNLSSVATNQTVKFPPRFKMPPAPDSQHMGWGIFVGLVGTVLMVVSGVVFCTYRSPKRSRHLDSALSGGAGGEDNLAFESQDHL